MGICRSVSGERLKRELQRKKHNECILAFFWGDIFEDRKRLYYKPVRKNYNKRKCHA